MPEYSSTTITPADGVQVPSMNGSTSGNFLLSALKSYILAEKGQANGLASLGSDGKLTAAQLPDLADDVIVVASYAVLPAAGTAGKIYITADNNKLYRWDPDLTTPDYVELSVDLSAYATKAELAEEESAREAADSNLKSAIRKDEARITNLEEKADPTGAYKTVNYRGTNDVPTGKAKYALVESIVGKSRAWNQLSDVTAWEKFGDVSIAVSNSKITMTATATTATSAQINLGFDFVNGHNYLIAFKFKPSDATTNARFLCQGLKEINYGAVSAGQTVSITGIFSSDTTSLIGLRIYFDNGATHNAGATVEVSDIIFRDLTPIFPEGVPSTVAECVQKCPDILKYDAYGTSIVDTTVEGVEVYSININDEIYESGSIDSSGAEVSDVTASRNKNYLTVEPSTQYFINTNLFYYFRGYDASKNFVSGGITYSATTGGYVLTTGANVRYLRVVFATTTPTDIQICLNSAPDKLIYHPHILDTLTLPSPVTLRSAGSVAEVYDLETGKVSHPIDSVDLGQLNWTIHTGGFLTSNGINSVIKKPANNSILANILAPIYNTITADALYGRTIDKAIACPNTGAVWINDSNISASDIDANNKVAKLNGITLYFELATPDPDTDLGVVIDNTIATEGGGTINTIQTQTPVIDNSMDVGYLAL